MQTWGKRLGIAGLILIVCLLVAALVGYPKAIRVKDLLTSIREHLWALEAKAQEGLAASPKMEDLKAIGDELAQAEADFRALKAELAPLLPLCRYLGWVPLVGEDIQAAPYLLEIAIEVTAAGGAVLEGLQPLTDLLSRDEPTTRGHLQGISEQLVPVLLAQQPKFTEAQRKLSEAAQARAGIEKGELSPRLAALVDRLDEYLPLLQPALRGALLAPELLGASEQKSYLILAQNDDEIRATGGFISGVGLLRIDQGRITQLDFQDSYAVDDLSQPHAEPPLPLRRYMWADIWLLRDANWSPDFPTTAQVAAQIYQQDQGVAVDGVIAIDQQAVRLVVGALGPLRLEGYEEPVTTDNVIQLARRYWASPLEAESLGEGTTGDWWAHRKDFMETFLEATMTRLEGGVTSAEAMELVKAIQCSVEERHLLIWLDDPAVSELLHDAGWDGTIQATDGDYLMIVDTNMGFNKVNPNVEEAIEYQVAIDEGNNVRAVVTITYHNKSTREVEECVQEARYDLTYEGMMNRCYWDYLRLYVPQGARLIEATRNPLPPGGLYRRLSGAGEGTGEPDIGPSEKGKEVFGTFFVVPPQESKEIRFAYEQPSSILEKDGVHRYSLLIQKQAGTKSLPVQITVELPPGVELVTAEPEPSTVEGNTVRYQLSLATDRRIELIYHQH